MRCCKNCGWLRWVTTTDTSYYCDFVGGEILGNLSECCQEWKSAIQTNADRIRSMTDEELSKWLGTRGHECPERWKACNIGIVDHEDDCIPCWLKWLKEEAKDGN